MRIQLEQEFDKKIQEERDKYEVNLVAERATEQGWKTSVQQSGQSWNKITHNLYKEYSKKLKEKTQA